MTLRYENVLTFTRLLFMIKHERLPMRFSSLKCGFLLFTLFFLGCSSKDPQQNNSNGQQNRLIGKWVKDNELTLSYSENQHLDLNSLKMEFEKLGEEVITAEFRPDGRLLKGVDGFDREFSYTIQQEEGDTLTIQMQMQITPDIEEHYESQDEMPLVTRVWIVIDSDKIGTKEELAGKDYWAVYRRTNN